MQIYWLTYPFEANVLILGAVYDNVRFLSFLMYVLQQLVREIHESKENLLFCRFRSTGGNSRAGDSARVAIKVKSKSHNREGT